MLHLDLGIHMIIFAHQVDERIYDHARDKPF
jgi:hypothetical protein